MHVLIVWLAALLLPIHSPGAPGSVGDRPGPCSIGHCTPAWPPAAQRPSPCAAHHDCAPAPRRHHRVR